MTRTYDHHGQVYCPVEGCEYWACFGGHLDLFVKSFKRHVRKDHRDLSAMDTRDKGGIIDRWIGDTLVNAECPLGAPQP